MYFQKIHDKPKKRKCSWKLLTFIALINCCIIWLILFTDLWRNPVSLIVKIGFPSWKQTDGTDLHWWQNSIIYQIYPRSFMDSDGSGIGDLKGITTKIDYLKDIGVGAIWLSPIYPSPMVDFGYDISNYYDIDPMFGTLEDFNVLLEKCKSNDIKLIMDFVPNHTSDQHQWFQKSIKKIDPYTDYYVWRDPKGFNTSGHPIPPNNWLGVFRFSAWEWNTERKQFYLHQFTKEQPDLNVRNPVVIEELEKLIKYWMDLGVDGLRVDAVPYLFEANDTNLNEPVDQHSGITDAYDHHYLSHLYTKNQPETYTMVKKWRKIIDEYDDRFMVVEVSGETSSIMKYYGTKNEPLSHFPFNFHLIHDLHNRSSITGINLKNTIALWYNNKPSFGWANWVLGNHDNFRVCHRYGKDLIDALNMVLLLLLGTPFTYYGEEIGMDNTYIPFEQVKDPLAINFGPKEYEKYGRDPSRTPMQWDSTKNAGFSSGENMWLPVNSNYKTVNVATQLHSNQSHLKVYKSLSELRKRKTFVKGAFVNIAASEDIFAFLRHLDGEPTYLIIINTSEKQITFDISKDGLYLGDLKEAKIEIRSSFDFRKETEPGSVVSLKALTLLPSEGLVLQVSGLLNLDI